MSDFNELNSDSPNPEEQEQIPSTDEPVEEQYEGTPEALTALKPVPGLLNFNRKRVMVIICCIVSFIVLFGIIFLSGGKKGKKNAAGNDYSAAARAPTEFLQREKERSLLQKPLSSDEPTPIEDFIPPEAEPLLPEATQVDLREPPKQQFSYREEEQFSGGVPPPQFVANFSPLVPQIAGSLFASQSSGNSSAPSTPSVRPPEPPPSYGSMGSMQTPARPASLQNDQDNKTSFFNSGESGGIISGNFLPSDILWVGTIIPAVLETAINTDLPGNVIARVTQNVYDSHTGKKLLIPQGTILIAKYNSSISYAQSRVQIVWDLLIRPDGYQIELQGMNAVDIKGMAGLRATYHENWFEYVKAAGIITLFSIANGKMAEEAAKYGTADTASGVVTQNSQFMNQLGGTVIGRAMSIQPTLTVASGEKINIFLNKNLYLPPMDKFPVTQKYILQ